MYGAYKNYEMERTLLIWECWPGFALLKQLSECVAESKDVMADNSDGALSAKKTAQGRPLNPIIHAQQPSPREISLQQPFLQPD